MTECSQCNRKVEQNANACPHCGFSPHENLLKVTILAIFLGLLFAVLFSPVGVVLLLLAGVGIVKLVKNDYTFGDST